MCRIMRLCARDRRSEDVRRKMPRQCVRVELNVETDAGDEGPTKTADQSLRLGVESLQIEVDVTAHGKPFDRIEVECNT